MGELTFNGVKALLFDSGRVLNYGRKPLKSSYIGYCMETQKRLASITQPTFIYKLF